MLDMPNAPSETSGAVAIACYACGGSLTDDDLGELGLRVPDQGETVDEYCGEELLDRSELRHLRCLEGNGEASANS